MKSSVIKSYIFLFIIALGFGSCNGVLDEEPTVFYLEDQIFVTSESAETAINGLYYALGTFDYYGSNYINLYLPHSGLFWTSQAANVDVAGLNATPSNLNVNTSWEGQFKTINAANIAIKNLEAKPEEFENKQKLLGHAYFIRGKVYLDLLRMYGGVPLRTEPSTVNTIHLARATKEQVVDLIIADLNKAKSLMPEIGELGRPAKYAANAYLAKLYMFLAQDNFANWQKAKDELTVIISSAKYSLLPTYAALFQPGNENTKESLFEIQYGHTGGSRTSDLPRLFTPSKSVFAPSNVATFGRLRPTKEVYDNHKKRYSDDPRLAATFVIDEYLKTDGTKQKIYPKQKKGNNSFAVIAKWFDPTFNGVTSNRNYILLRYADVLLMMAEVVNEIEGPDAAFIYVNQVLSRARDTDGDGNSNSMAPANYANMTQEEFRERIMFERRYELLSEGEDWFDTRRRGLDFFLKTVVTPHNNNANFDVETDYKYSSDAKNMLLPIPLTEISGNQEIGPDDQNPGY